MKKPRMLFIFLDGVGIGTETASNPFLTAQTTFLPFFGSTPMLPDNTPIKPIDATLGVNGLPQSATGQTTLFTGVNIPRMLNLHMGSYPNAAMRRIIRENNILLRLSRLGLNAGFINAYPFSAHLFEPIHVEIQEDGSFYFSSQFPENFKRRISVTTCMLIANRRAPFGEEDIRRERSIYQDFSNCSINQHIRELRESGALEREIKRRSAIDIGELPEFSPEKAAAIFYKTSREFDFLLYEYFQTDTYAHRNTFEEQEELLRRLNRFVGSLILMLDREQDTLILTSDHGNIEDGTSTSHTRNPVPLLVWGANAATLRHNIESLAHVTPAIEDFFRPAAPKPPSTPSL